MEIVTMQLKYIVQFLILVDSMLNIKREGNLVVAKTIFFSAQGIAINLVGPWCSFQRILG